MALLRFDGLSFAYPYASRRTLQDVSFEMAEGEYLVLCGPSGCGKTTLLKQAKRELRPAGSREGQVLYQNTPVDMLDAEMAFTEIGYVQQNPEDQIVTDFVWHELAFGLENLALPTKVIRRRVAEMAAFFGMETWFRKKTSELSGGQKQMLNLASVMAMNPKLLILDEPTSGLDPVSRDDLLDLLRSLCEQDGVSILFSTHITSDLDACADDVTYLQNGTVAASCPLSEFTAPWKKLTGPEASLTPELKKTLRGVRVHRGEFEALYPSDLPCPAGCREELADLQTVMVYLEREVETV